MNASEKLKKIKIMLSLHKFAIDTEVQDGMILISDSMDPGSEVFIEVDGEYKPAPDGDYKTKEGKIITITGGLIVEIKDAPVKEVSDETEMKTEEKIKTEVTPVEIKMSEEDFTTLMISVEKLKVENAELKKLTDVIKEKEALIVKMSAEIETLGNTVTGNPVIHTPNKVENVSEDRVGRIADFIKEQKNKNKK